MPAFEVQAVTMTPSSIARLLDNAPHPLPAFGSLSESPNVTMLGVTYNIPPASQFAVVPIQVDGQLKDFKIFETLPTEMQTKIWGLALTGRTITAFERPKSDDSTSNNKKANAGNDKDKSNDAPTEDSKEGIDVKNAFRFVGAEYPTIFRVSKKIKQLAGAMGYTPLFQVHGSPKMVVFNGSIDTLRLHTAVTRTDLSAQIPLAVALVNKFDLHHVRYLELSIQAFHNHFSNVSKDIKSMPSLRELVLHGFNQTRPASPQFTFKMWFESVGGVARAAAHIPHHHTLVTGTQLVDTAVWNAFKYWVPDPDMIARQKQIQGDIEESVENAAKDPVSSPFPPRVELKWTFLA